MSAVDRDAKLTLAICAYKDNPFLEDAVVSAKRQTVPVHVVIATSTPSDYIRRIAERHEVACLEHAGSGIASDWSFAISDVRTPYATIAHQDDIYFPRYAEKVIEGFQKAHEPLIAFTDYCDLTSDGKYHAHRLYLWIKRFLLWSFYLKHIHRSRFWKRMPLIFGNAVSCPTVSFNMRKLGRVTFDHSFSVNLDWAQWLALADQPGEFVFVPHVLVAHRIGESMETAKAIMDNRRYQEDFRIFESIWGGKMAAMIMKFYRLAYGSNA